VVLKFPHDIIAPSPQLSQDDLVRELGVINKHGISPTTSTGLLSPSVCASPKHQATDEMEKIDVVEDETEEDINGNGKCQIKLFRLLTNC
jgi:hypothetical protein